MASIVDQLHIKQARVEFKGNALDLLSADKNDLVYYSFSGMQQEYYFGTPDLPRPEEVGEVPVYYFDTYKGQPVRMMAAIMSDADGVRVNVTVAKTLVLHHQRAREWVWRVLPAHINGGYLALVWWA
jgi:hypothetical protein